MSGLFDSLGIAASGIMAQQHGIQVTSHNISNVSTPGYTRQELELTGAGPATLGVTDAGARRVIDAFLGQRLYEQQGQTAYADTRSSTLTEVESLFGSLDDQGLGSALSKFFAGFRDLAAAADDPTVRAQALSNTEALASRIRSAAGDLSDAEKQADSGVVAGVGQANGLIDQVAALNRSIAIAEASGSEASDLRDTRDTAVKSLAELVGATSFTDGQGQLSVLVGGVSVVQGDNARHLITAPDATTGFAHVFVGSTTGAEITGRITSGKVGALLTLRDQDLTTAATELDQLAFDLATAVNTQHQLGVGQDGVSGRNLFAPPAAVAGAAAALTVDPAVAGAPDHLGAALVAGAAGDGRGADAIAQLETTNVANGGQVTLSQALTTNLTSFGNLTATAASDLSAQNDRLTTLTNLRESESGVSIDEQMVALQRYQSAFQAASRVLSAVDQMLQQLLAIGVSG